MTDNTVITKENSGMPDPEMKSRRTITLVIYALQGLSFFVGLTGLVAIIMNYVKRGDMSGTWLESHFNWQIRTFWYAILWMFVGALLMMVGIGWLVFLANAVWVIYRIVRGILSLLDNKPMYQ